MDPLTITSQVASLVFTCMKTAKALNDIKDKYRHAALTIASIQCECTVMSAALSQIQASICSNLARAGERMGQQQQLTTSFEIALLGCASTFSVLDEELKELQGDGGHPSRVQRARYVWKEEVMNELLQQLRGQQGALQLLLTALHTDSLTELRELFRNNNEVLQNVLNRTRTNRRTRHTRNSLAGFSSVSYNSNVTDTEFTFDDEIVNSRAYRRALRTVTRPNRPLGPRQRYSEAPTMSDYDSQADTVVGPGSSMQSTLRRRDSQETVTQMRTSPEQTHNSWEVVENSRRSSREFPKRQSVKPPLPPRTASSRYPRQASHEFPVDEKKPHPGCSHKERVGCLLTAVPTCCSCSDTRPNNSQYPVYQDGIGLFGSARRWTHYCPNCVLYWEKGIESGPLQQTNYNTVPTTTSLEPDSEPSRRRRILGIFPRWR